ncbi:MAG: type II toxin-antitoxin system HicA family toxin [Spirochaetaceae bacterium]|jgi:predicted RNA binding protein YcfA (HicA-like mRNA interferase family)|nr:type II toxin-antitoxin system HicA family toxin [Spirochaetaceae bacterium]
MPGKYPLLRPAEIITALDKRGFRYKSQRGSHAKYSNGTRKVIIPMHSEVARGTLRGILQQAGIELDDFLTLL